MSSEFLALLVSRYTRELFGKAKDKKATGHSPAPEVEQRPSEPAILCPDDEQRDTERLGVEKTETALGATGAGARELEAAALISESELSGRLPDEAGKVAPAERETEPDTTREREGQRPNPHAKADSLTSNSINALVIPIKHLHLKDYFQGLINKLLDYHCKGIFTCGGIFPESVRAIMKEEDMSVQLFLAVLQLQIDTRQILEESKKARVSDKTKTQQNARQKKLGQQS
jgi:hypothetical protein